MVAEAKDPAPVSSFQWSFQWDGPWKSDSYGPYGWKNSQVNAYDFVTKLW